MKQDSGKTEPFRELLQASLKSSDTEEWLDVHFTRKVGLLIALACRKIGIRPNTVTIISILLGIASAFMFYHTDLMHNLLGVVLLMSANCLDSADGQLARLTNSKSLLGRILDGVAGDVWFISIYIALCLRVTIGAAAVGQWWIVVGVWLLGAVAGLLCHSVQSAQADYYRQIHLWMLKGEADAELWQQKSNPQQSSVIEGKPWYAVLFDKGYAHYSRAQQRRAPNCQRMIALQADKYKKPVDMLQAIRDEFLSGSRPLMKWTNILTFNTRAIVLYICCLLNMPWLYFIFEIVVLHPIYFYMRSKHETLCKQVNQALYPV